MATNVKVLGEHRKIERAALRWWRLVVVAAPAGIEGAGSRMGGELGSRRKGHPAGCQGRRMSLEEQQGEGVEKDSYQECAEAGREDEKQGGKGEVRMPGGSG